MNPPMKKTILLSLLVLLLAAVACGKNNSSGKSNPPSLVNPVVPGVGVLPNMGTTADQLIQNINERRLGWGLRPLVRDHALDQYAQSDALDLADGRQGFRRFNMCRSMPRSLTGRVCRSIAHIGMRPSVDFVFRDWLREDEGRNMLANRIIERAGVGFAVNAQGEQVWVVLMTSLD